MAGIVEFNDRIAALVGDGASLDQVETEVIETSNLEADQKAALWLYAWSVMELREQGGHHSRYLLNVGPG